MMENEKKYSLLRNEIGNYIQNLGEKNDKVVVVNADLMGTCRNTSFVNKFPCRSFNVGIAEQNMISFSAGLATEGFIPYAFSMAPFISMRACEQCRTDVAYGNLNVRLIATYAGCSGGISGATHWAIEDVAIMNSIPNMVVLEPCDAIQTKKMLDASLEYAGPIYMRSTIEPVLDVYDEDYKFEMGKASIVRNGDDGAFICSGITVQFALEAAERIFNETKKSIRVIDMHTIKPIDREAIISAAKTGCVIVAHDHNIKGGLGQIVASVIVEEGLSVKFKSLGFKDEFVAMAHAQYLYREYEYDAEGLYKNMMKIQESMKNE